MLESASGELKLIAQKFNPIEIYWENIMVVATIEQRRWRHIPCCAAKTTKVIIDQCTGITKPGTFTAIMGPSGIFIIKI